MTSKTEMETKLKIFITLTIPYVFLCAGLYHIAFWTPFGIHIFSFLDVVDIIKSIISPFLYSSFAAMFCMFLQYSSGSEALPYGGGNTKPASTTKKIIWASIRVLYFVSISYFLIVHEDKWKGLYVPWLMAPGLFFVLVEFLLKKGVIEHQKFNFFAIYFLVMLPIFSFSSGTLNAKKIFDNTQFDYASNVIPKKTIKFLAKASDYYIFVSIDNKDKYFFSVDEIKGLDLKEYKAK